MSREPVEISDNIEMNQFRVVEKRTLKALNERRGAGKKQYRVNGSSLVKFNTFSNATMYHAISLKQSTRKYVHLSIRTQSNRGHSKGKLSLFSSICMFQICLV